MGDCLLEYLIKEEEGQSALHLTGILSFSDSEVVQALIDELAATSMKACAIDIAALEKIDSSGLGMLLLINDALVDQGASVQLVGAQGQVLKMLELSKFSEIIPMS